MNRGISNRARAYIRSRAEANLTYECRIERVSAGTFDVDDSIYTAGEATELYEGPCRVWQVSGGNAVDINSEGLVLQQTKISIPWNEGIGVKRDDEVKILAATYDAALVGKRFRIMDVDKGGDLRATRTFTVQTVQEEA